MGFRTRMAGHPARALLGASLSATLGAALAMAETPSAPVGRLSGDQFALLAERLRESDSFKVRLQAALLLGAAGGPEAEPLLVQALQTDGTPAVQAAAALGLGQTQDERAFPPLVTALDSTDGFLREQAEKGLARLTDGFPDGPLKLWGYLALADPQAQQRGLAVLGDLQASGVDGLLAALAAAEPSGRLAAQDELARLPPDQLVAGLRASLRRKDPDRSPLAAAMLADRGDPALLPALADAATDPTQPTAVQAEARSGLLRLAGAIDPATERQRFGSEDPQDRVRAVALLAVKGGQPAEDLALRALGDPNLRVQAAGATALADLGALAGLGPIQALLKREEEGPILRVLEISARRLARKQAP